MALRTEAAKAALEDRRRRNQWARLECLNYLLDCVAWGLVPAEHTALQVIYCKDDQAKELVKATLPRVMDEKREEWRASAQQRRGRGARRVDRGRPGSHEPHEPGRLDFEVHAG